MDFSEVKEIIRVDTDTKCQCQIGGCDEQLLEYDFTKSVKHYLKVHNCKLLHIGQETGSSNYQMTVAILKK